MVATDSCCEGSEVESGLPDGYLQENNSLLLICKFLLLSKLFNIYTFTLFNYISKTFKLSATFGEHFTF